jgi:hypothetical protein
MALAHRQASQAPGLATWRAGSAVHSGQGNSCAKCPYVGARVWLTPRERASQPQHQVALGPDLAQG